MSTTVYTISPAASFATFIDGERLVRNVTNDIFTDFFFIFLNIEDLTEIDMFVFDVFLWCKRIYFKTVLTIVASGSISGGPLSHTDSDAVPFLNTMQFPLSGN